MTPSTRKGEIVFYDELHEPLTRAVCAWAGVPLPDDEAGNRAGELRALFDALAANHPRIDTLSMGMSGDYLTAIEAGATLVVG